MSGSRIANFFLDKAREEKLEITNLKLQKLMFIGYGWVLALTGRDLTDGEGFQAWKHGPVSPTVYHQFKRFGSSPLPVSERAIEFEDGLGVYLPTLNDKLSTEILTKAWEVYKDFSNWYLKCLIQEPHTPWSNSFLNSDSGRRKWIPSNDVSGFYTGELDRLL